MESHGTLPTEQDDLIVRNLVGQTHVGGHPLSLVHLGSLDLLPSIPRDVIHLHSVHYLLLVYPSTKSKNVVVFESAKGCTGTGHFHLSDHLPLILLGIIHFTVAIDCVAYEGPHNIDEVLDCADGVIGMRVVHGSNMLKYSKQLIISVAILQVYLVMLHIATCQVN